MSEGFLSKNANFGAKKFYFGETMSKINIMSNPNLLCRKFAVVCPENSIFLPRLFFLTHAPLNFALVSLQIYCIKLAYNC